MLCTTALFLLLGSSPLPAASQQSFRPWLPKLTEARASLPPALCPPRSLAEQEHSKSWSLASLFRAWNQHHPGFPPDSVRAAVEPGRLSGTRRHGSPHRLVCPPIAMVPSLQQLLLHPQPGWWVVGLGSVHILCWAGSLLLLSTCLILIAQAQLRRLHFRFSMLQP